MKMGQALFWGILLLVMGISIIIKMVFKLDIPVFRLVIGLFLLALGIGMLTGKNIFRTWEGEENEVIFSEKTFSGKALLGKEYSVIFGHAVFDLRETAPSDFPEKIKINTVFASSEILVNSDVQVKVNGSAVFSGASLPGGSTVVFGSLHYESEDLSSGKGILYIDTDVVFGGLQIRVIE